MVFLLGEGRAWVRNCLHYTIRSRTSPLKLNCSKFKTGVVMHYIWAGRGGGGLVLYLKLFQIVYAW